MNLSVKALTRAIRHVIYAQFPLQHGKRKREKLLNIFLVSWVLQLQNREREEIRKKEEKLFLGWRKFSSSSCACCKWKMRNLWCFAFTLSTPFKKKFFEDFCCTRNFFLFMGNEKVMFSSLNACFLQISHIFPSRFFLSSSHSRNLLVLAELDDALLHPAELLLSSWTSTTRQQQL